MTAKRQNFEIYIGDDVDILFTVYDEDGDLLVVTGATIYWNLRPSAGATAILTKSVGSGIVISGSTFTVTLPYDNTEDIDAGTYFHSAVVTLSGKIRTVAIGQVIVSAR